ncbi:Tc toxin subunit A-related protein [Pseudomonas sp. 210_17 TE3656]
MNSQLPLLAKLKEDRREAMVKYFLGQVAPAQGTASGQLKTAEDLYQYQLLDNQVSDKVKTSWVAETIASFQQCIHGIYNGMEPGHDSVFNRDEVEYWRNWESQYAIWSANEMLQYYPENYIDPSLRLKKTELFKTVEMDINQARISDKHVRKALMNYLNKFDQVSNLSVVSGYMDGNDRRKSDYYFIGREKFSLNRYYYRKARVLLQPGNTRLDPTVWDEWTEINLGFGNDVTHIRPVYSAGRLYLVWVERTTFTHEPEGEDKGKSEWRYEVKLSYLDLNGIWAVPMSAGCLATPNISERYALMAISINSFSQAEAVLAVVLVPTIPATEEVLVKAWDSLSEPLSLGTDEQGQLTNLATARYSDPAVVQKCFSNLTDGISGIDYELGSVTENPEPIDGWRPHKPEGGINQYLELEAEVVSANEKEVTLNVRGKCTAIRKLDRVSRLQLTAHLKGLGGRLAVIEIQEGDHQGGECLATLKSSYSLPKPSIVSVELWYKAEKLLSFEHSDRKPGYRQFILSSEIMDVILAASLEDVKKGFDFKVKIGGLELGFVNDSNYRDLKSGASISPTLQIWKRTGSGYGHQESIWHGSPVLNGHVITSQSKYRQNVEGYVDPTRHAFIFGASHTDDATIGYNWFDVKLKAVEDKTWAPKIATLENGGQFLAFNDSGFQVSSVRLNSLFSQHLIKRLEVSVDELLSWDAQHTLEPAMPEIPGGPVPLDFNGANGRYLWELFFHIPHLIAQRLKLELNHADAQNWLHYIFNPAARDISAERETQSYWQVRPLLEPGDISHETEGPTDPDAIAYSNPEHYRKTIFTDYVRNLIDWADSLYRRQTRDSLSEAKLLYVRALSLMGNPPDYRGVSRWQPATLESLASSDTARLSALEASIGPELMANIPARPGEPVWWGVLDSPAFRPPLNELLLDIWTTLASRLSNMRQNLTLDGKPMSLQLYEAMADPRDLLRAQAGSTGFGQRNPGGHFVVPPYRFTAILPRAQSAVETLMRFGDQVRQFMEQGDRAQQEETVQGQLVEMAGFTVQLQEESIAQNEATTAALEANLAAVQLRYKTYCDLVENDVSNTEEEAMGLMASAIFPMATSGAFSSIGGALDTLPNIFGIANGGARPSGPAYAGGALSSIFSTEQQSRAGNLDASERYRRRKEEWEQQRDLASKEEEALTAQVAVQGIQSHAATTVLAQQKRAQSHTDQLYTFLTKTRSTKVSLYRWLLGQMSTLYFQAYDAVTALCMSAQASWQYEIGDYDTHYIQPNVWFDNYHGLTAGDALKLALLNMESAFVNRNERRDEIAKTLSLRQLFGEEAWSGAGGALETLKRTGSLPFSLTGKMLDEDYPGSYLRQLLRVSVTLPVVLGPYQDIKARLLQVSSKTVIKPDLAAIKYCHDVDDKEGSPANIKFNLRPYGQIAISTGMDDNGVLQMSFDDGRYFPFEGTGADSEWLVEFPRYKLEAQQKLLANLTDIIVHIHYTAVAGGQAFASQVEVLLDKAR